MNLLRLHLPPSGWSGWAASGRRRVTTIVGWPDATSNHPTRAHIGLIRTTTIIGMAGGTTKVTGIAKIMNTGMDMDMITTSQL
jgi:hypothetical protein